MARKFTPPQLLFSSKWAAMADLRRKCAARCRNAPQDALLVAAAAAAAQNFCAATTDFPLKMTDVLLQRWALLQHCATRAVSRLHVGTHGIVQYSTNVRIVRFEFSNEVDQKAGAFSPQDFSTC